MNNMLTVEEVKSFLEVDQQELEKYLKQGRLQAYKIGGTYVRFRKEDILTLRHETVSRKPGASAPGAGILTRVADFWRFNNFYIVSLLLALALLFLIFRI